MTRKPKRLFEKRYLEYVIDNDIEVAGNMNYELVLEDKKINNEKMNLRK